MDTKGEAFGPALTPEELTRRKFVTRLSICLFALGSVVLNEPRLWPEYHASYYGAFVRDPDGNNIEAVCHRPE